MRREQSRAEQGKEREKGYGLKNTTCQNLICWAYKITSVPFKEKTSWQTTNCVRGLKFCRHD